MGRFLLLVVSAALVSVYGQGSGSLRVSLEDASAAPLASQKIELRREAGDARQVATTDSTGIATFTNLPWDRYQLIVAVDGFRPVARSVVIRSTVPESAELRLEVGPAETSLTVVEEASLAGLDPEQTGARAHMGRELMDRLALQSGNRGLEQVLLTFPGFAKNANGAIHPRGAHNQMTYIIDGMPVSDQLGGAFAGSIDPSLVESVELFTGNIPAEFGNKVSAVAQVTTRTGFGTGRKFTGTVASQAAQFDTLSQSAQAAGEAGKLAWSAMGIGMETHRYLDSVSLDNLHNGGNMQRGFLRLDYRPGARDTLRFSFSGGRSSFESANLRSQQANGMRQRQYLSDTAYSATWLRVIDARSTFETNASYRPMLARLLPSGGDIPVTAWQERTQGTVTLNARYSRLAGAHNWRGGVDYQTYPLHEQFRFAVTGPGFGPDLDVRRFDFAERGRGSLASAFFTDQIRLDRWTLSLGLRYDSYRFLVNGGQWQPRLGLAYHMRETGTVLRLSYNRLYQTPPNENLLLSNSEAALAVTPRAVRDFFGNRVNRIQPERQNFFEAGLQQRVSNAVTFSASVYHKNATDQQDNNNFFDTGIIFPITLAKIRVNGAEGRVEFRERRFANHHAISGSVSVTHARAISTPPFTGGLYLGNDAIEALSAGPFVIDHDQALGVHGVLAYTHRRGWFGTLNSRYDSGLVANPSDAAEVAADPDYFDLLPLVNLASDPARVRPRTVHDIALGYRHGADKTRWEAMLQVSNLANAQALYNFQSVFVGTRVVQPRTLGVRWRVFF
jgi:outer membrane cobalamin receptor